MGERVEKGHGRQAGGGVDWEAGQRPLVAPVAVRFSLSRLESLPTPMLGPPKARALDRPVVASLETLVPTDHFYRYLDATLDLSFVRDWVKDCYALGGRPSIDPVVFFKLQLLMFFEGIRSERKLIEMASLNLAHRWYVGYNLDEPLPDHSSLTRIRQRLGLSIFRRFFEHVVELCQQAGLVWGKELLFDATKVRANASMESVVPRLQEVIDDHLVDLFGPAAHGGEGDGEAADSPSADRSSSRWDLLEECRLDPARPESPGYQRLSGQRISLTDPDATLMRAKIRSALQLGFHDHYVVDGGRARIILHVLVTPADVMENQPMLHQLRRVTFRHRIQPKRAIADTTYGTIENIVALEESGIKAYVPLPDLEERTPYYPISRFEYDSVRDVYHCPEGTELPLYTMKYTEDTMMYRANAAVCNACPVKAACTPSTTGRSIRRSMYEEYVERVRVRHQTAAYAKAMRKRKVWVEPLFGEAKQWHGLGQFRLRGLQKVNMEGLFIATGQNLKRWLRAAGWGRRQLPGGAVTALCLPT
jgi:transposase